MLKYIAIATNKDNGKETVLITNAYDTEKLAVMDLFNQFRNKNDDDDDEVDDEGWKDWIQDHINTLDDLIELTEEYIAGKCRNKYYPYNKNNWSFSVEIKVC